VPRQWIALAVVALLLLSGGGFWYYQSMSDYLRQQAAMVAPAPVAAEEPVVVPEPVPAEKPVVAKASAPKAAAPAKTAVAAAVPVTTPAPAPVESAGARDAGAPPAPVAEDVPAAPVAPLGVARDADARGVYALLQQAYAAYQSGDDVRAQIGYAQVLSADEHNRDAMLGLAAIAVRNRDIARAQEIYAELLTLDPKDSMAQAGLAGLTTALDPVAEEARLKTLLSQEPNAPHLLFAYASLLMQQQRWSEAARALQSAHQARGDQPDYAYNLAVSLDHLGQAEAALRYYRRALELSAKQPSAFRPGDAQRRIAALEAAPDGASR
jgi:tetratricopeptide (TPR) repeat protein